MTSTQSISTHHEQTRAVSRITSGKPVLRRPSCHAPSRSPDAIQSTRASRNAKRLSEGIHEEYACAENIVPRKQIDFEIQCIKDFENTTDQESINHIMMEDKRIKEVVKRSKQLDREETALQAELQIKFSQIVEQNHQKQNRCRMLRNKIEALKQIEIPDDTVIQDKFNVKTPDQSFDVSTDIIASVDKPVHINSAPIRPFSISYIFDDGRVYRKVLASWANKIPTTIDAQIDPSFIIKESDTEKHMTPITPLPQPGLPPKESSHKTRETSQSKEQQKVRSLPQQIDITEEGEITTNIQLDEVQEKSTQKDQIDKRQTTTLTDISNIPHLIGHRYSGRIRKKIPNYRDPSSSSSDETPTENRPKFTIRKLKAITIKRLKQHLSQKAQSAKQNFDLASNNPKPKLGRLMSPMQVGYLGQPRRSQRRRIGVPHQSPCLDNQSSSIGAAIY